MHPAATIRLKRDGQALDDVLIREFIEGISDGRVSDAHLGAFLMAIYCRGMTAREQATLTLAMRDSGQVMRWDDLPGPVLDKHSTGGVGDLVSLILGPLIAACGGFVPMISGRGLGHTGGTLDKMESIPGLTVNPSLPVFRRTVRDAGFAMVGQGPDLAPADQRMYAARDVTATVSCEPLIVSSILSKKLSEGLDGLVMDIKTGNGAVMQQEEDSIALGEAICRVAEAAGLRCSALVTDMSQPLADSAGNALEMKEAIEFMKGGFQHPRLRHIVFALCRELLALGGIESNEKRAQQRLEHAISSGDALERFARMVALQGGPADLTEQPKHYLAAAPVLRPVPAPRSGVIVAIETRAIGMLVHSLGGGRSRAEDQIDPSVGLTGLPSIGDHIEKGQPLAWVHASCEDHFELASSNLVSALELGDETPSIPPMIHQKITRQAGEEET